MVSIHASISLGRQEGDCSLENHHYIKRDEKGTNILLTIIKDSLMKLSINSKVLYRDNLEMFSLTTFNIGRA